MIGWLSRHPGSRDLLRSVDGKLSAAKELRIRKHLEHCAECRAAVAEFQETNATAAAYWRARKAAMPEPPVSWPSLSAGFARIDADARYQPAVGRVWRMPSIRWSAAIAASLVLLAAAFYEWRETPSVQAATLLRKAVAAADARPRASRRLRIRTGGMEFTRTIGQAPEESGARMVEALFRSANYSWDDPLGAKSFGAWRAGLANKRDEIVRASAEPGNSGSYSIRTITTDSELTTATLTLRVSDLEPTTGRFEFRNSEWVEIAETEEPNEFTDSPASAIPEAASGIPTVTEMPPRPEAAPEPEGAPLSPAVGIAAELQVFAALRQVGADLGDPLEIERRNSQVTVSGAGIAPARQRQLHAVLDALPNVSLRFTQPEGAPAAATAAPVAVPPAPAGPSLLQQKFGGRVQFENLKSQLLDHSDAAMARAYALRRLAQEFSPETARAMAAADKALLNQLARQHLDALASETGAIDSTVSPVLGLRAASRAEAPATERGPWQPAVEDVMRSARDVETSLAALIGAAPAEAGGDPASRYATAVSSLRAGLERCRLLLSYDDVGQR